MSLKEDIQKYGHYLNVNPEDPVDLIELILSALGPSELSAVELKVTAVLEPAKDLHYVEIEKSIRVLAIELPKENDLRKAIDAIH